jgi:hypothetical protein
MLEFLDRHKNGILGTIALHLMVLVVFFFLKIGENKRMLEDLSMVEVKDAPEIERLLQQMSKGKEAVITSEKGENEQKNLPGNQGNRNLPGRSNIPVNVSEKFKENISSSAYEKQVLKEMNIQSLHQQHDPDEILKSEKGSVIAGNEAQNQIKSNTISYHGKTNITYNLLNRHHSNLSIPVYKCEGAGEVVVNILVDQRGNVVDVSIASVRTNDDDECFSAAAKSAALRSHFNASYDAPAKQKGTISYEFVAQ